MRASWFVLLAACSATPAGPQPVITRAVVALDHHDLAALEDEYVSAAQWSSLLDCSNANPLPLAPPDRNEALRQLYERAADFASEPTRHIWLELVEPVAHRNEWRTYRPGDAFDQICKARHAFREEKYRIVLDFSTSFHGTRSMDTEVRVWNVDGRYWIESDLLF